jgi:ERCC4-related helicase
MAPTKPLVTQQIEACYNIAGIPQAHCIILSGNTAAAQRQKLWAERRMFFATPQTVRNA